MKNYALILFSSLIILSCGSAKSDYKDDVREIKRVLEMQQNEWSDNDIEGFMDGYWNSNELRFYGNNGLTTGYNQVLNNYKIKYPNKDLTGTLKYEIDAVTPISADAYYVMGKYRLDRKAGDADGAFMVIFKKINGQWKIIADMSS